MKKIILFVSFVVFSFVVYAQKTGDVQIGAKAGANIASFKGDGTNNSDQESGTALQAGMFMRYFIASTLALGPELFYGGHGGKEGLYTYRFSSIFLPILITYYLSSFYLTGGPQLNFLLSAQQKHPGGTDDIKQYYRTLNFALVLGLGYMLGNRFGLDARYSFGLGDIHKDGVANSAVQNSIFMISLMWLLSSR